MHVGTSVLVFNGDLNVRRFPVSVRINTKPILLSYCAFDVTNVQSKRNVGDDNITMSSNENRLHFGL